MSTIVPHLTPERKQFKLTPLPNPENMTQQAPPLVLVPANSPDRLIFDETLKTESGDVLVATREPTVKGACVTTRLGVARVTEGLQLRLERTGVLSVEDATHANNVICVEPLGLGVIYQEECPVVMCHDEEDPKCVHGRLWRRTAEGSLAVLEIKGTCQTCHKATDANEWYSVQLEGAAKPELDDPHSQRAICDQCYSELPEDESSSYSAFRTKQARLVLGLGVLCPLQLKQAICSAKVKLVSELTKAQIEQRSDFVDRVRLGRLPLLHSH